MDIPRQQKRNTRRPLLAIGAPLLLIALLSLAWIRYEDFLATNYVERDSVVVAEVTHGELVREVRAPGNLVPAELRWVAATSNARVREILLDPGDPVDQNSVVMLLDNPDLEQALDSASLELEVLEAEFRALEQRLRNERLTQESVVAEMEANYEMADFRMNANQQLAEDRVVSIISLNESVLEERQFKTRLGLERRRLESLADLHEAELAAKRARINQSERALQLQQRLFNELTVRAEFSGHLQEIPVEQGQQVSIGAILARVANNDSLKAELRVQESQVKDVSPGQPVIVSAGNNRAAGTVRRVEPEVQDGVVIVDVYFDDGPLAGARSDLRIEGIIQLERLEQVLSMQRPVFSQEDSGLDIYVLDGEGQTATQRHVRLGRASTDRIQIVAGLEAGSRVIVSDTTRFAGLETLTLR